MRVRVTVVAVMCCLAGSAGAEASSTAVTHIRAVYRAVLTAEYFGPASAVCSHLTAAGAKSFTAGGPGPITCVGAFQQEQRVLMHKTEGVDDSGYSPAQWRGVVASVMAHLKVTAHGKRATAIGGQSGIPGQTTLVDVKGKWLFSSYPPSVGP
jgi:hypothetical protein